jgi:cation diffusion facilitator CzcD-associated flavoprotein CzcO
MTERYDALVIGAGAAGLYELHLLREKGLTVRVVEAGSGVGGAWYWNRYPGARLHSESYSYQYFFSPQLLEEWDWSELFAGQPELERYFNRVADVYDLRKDIDFDTRVVALTFDEADDGWIVRTDTGREYRAHVVISAMGPISRPIYPDVPGLDTFAGESHHTARWPKEAVSFAGKRVAVVGTGASAVQIIPHIVRESAHLSVLMRTANWIVPLNNRPLDAEEMAAIRAGYPELHEHLKGTLGGFVHNPDPELIAGLDDEARLARYERGWSGSGFSKWFGMPADIMSDETANRQYAEFIAGTIRARIDDPELADRLVPTDVFGSKPVDCEGGEYYEAFNRPDVELVEVGPDPIVEVVPEGIRLASGRLIEADVIVYATGFEAFVGALNAVEVTGVGGVSLRERWKDGPSTLLGLQVSGFPNLFVIGGPHGKGGHGNSTRCSEVPVQWVAELTATIVREGIRRVEPDAEAEREWTAHVYEVGNASLAARGRSYLFGDNIPGRPRAYVAYTGSLPDFVQRLTTVAENDYEGFILTR